MTPLPVPARPTSSVTPPGPVIVLERLAAARWVSEPVDLLADLDAVACFNELLADGRDVSARPPLGDLDRALLELAQLPRRPRAALKLTSSPERAARR